jgi:hypothetical protein
MTQDIVTGMKESRLSNKIQCRLPCIHSTSRESLCVTRSGNILIAICFDTGVMSMLCNMQQKEKFLIYCFYRHER